MGDQARHKYVEQLKRLVAGAVKSSMDAHGKVDPGSVAKRVAGQMWARTMPKGHADLAAYVLYVRGELGLTQQELADKIGCHQVTIARWESGEQAPRGKRLEAIQALAQELPVNLSQSSPDTDFPN